MLNPSTPLSNPTVSRLQRYPVKGLGGEPLTLADLTETGIEFDRVLALPTGSIPLERYGTWTTHVAFHTLISRAELARSTARIVQSTRERGAEREEYVEITNPERGLLRIPIRNGVPRPDLARGGWSALEGTETTPVHLGVHLWDVADASVSIINLVTIRELSNRTGIDLDPARFRANLYVEGLPAWQEFDWLARHLRIGDAELEVIAPIERCRATSARPGGTEWDLNVPGVLAGHFGHVFCGLYARVVRPATVSTSDPIAVIEERPHITVADGLLLDPAAPRWCEIEAITQLPDGVYTLVIRDHTGMLEEAQAGQYLRVHGSDGQPSWRNYTISGRANGTGRITIQPDSGGRFSPWLAGRAPGQHILVSGPFGASVLTNPDAPVVLATAGIGITPALALLQRLVEQQPATPVTVIHTARRLDHIPHWDEVLAAANALPSCTVDLFLTTPTGAVGLAATLGDACGQSTTETNDPASSQLDRQPIRHRAGRPSAADLAVLMPDPAAHVFTCGPNAYLDLVRDSAAIAGILAEHVHLDPFYSPPEADQRRTAPPTPGPWTITWADGRRTTWVEADGTLLDHAESQRIPAPAACRSGVCGTCSARVHGSTATVFTPFADAKAPGEQLLCSVVPTADLRVDLASSQLPLREPSAKVLTPDMTTSPRESEGHP